MHSVLNEERDITILADFYLSEPIKDGSGSYTVASVEKKTSFRPGSTWNPDGFRLGHLVAVDRV